MNFDWNSQIRAQLETHWSAQLRPRLEGLTDDEYFWEPAPGAWNVRPKDDGFMVDFTVPPPEPAPVTTIAWRLGHLIVVMLGMRALPRFGGPAVDFSTFPYAGTAATALTQLDEAYRVWSEGVESLGTEGLTLPAYPDEPAYDGWSTASIVLHVQRELLHHGAEIALLRDLYRARS
ncbi:DinB family protein [Kribbella sp. NPDC056861]|uniref:DinB family protein n=1 Tax=Kribbella sp. NPDC056861 TaxID=3154857 RepID=UPI00343F98F5